MDTLQRSDTVLFQTINSALYQLEYKLSYYKIGFFILLIIIAVIIVVLTVINLSDLWSLVSSYF